LARDEQSQSCNCYVAPEVVAEPRELALTGEEPLDSTVVGRVGVLDDQAGELDP
jgi:hypothetical protein